MNHREFEQYLFKWDFQKQSVFLNDHMTQVNFFAWFYPK